jgi:thiol-disulfide isomerase/thioredoxin
MALRLMTIFAGAVALAFIAGCSGGAAVATPPAAKPAIQQAAWPPAFTCIDGKELRPADDAATKAIVLVFILPECPICNSYMPELKRLHAVFVDRGVSFALVHADSEVTEHQANKHAGEYQIAIPVVLDPRHEWVNRAGATIAPQAAVFSPAGQIVYLGRIDDRYVGLGKRRANVTSHDLRDAIEAVLGGQPVANARTEAVGCPIPPISSGE